VETVVKTDVEVLTENAVETVMNGIPDGKDMMVIGENAVEMLRKNAVDAADAVE
jgi:hypothetical protein